MNSVRNYLGSTTPKYSPEDILLRLSDAEKTVSALANVINYIITDAFELTPEESIWVSRLLHTALDPLKKIIPTATLGAVKQEMNTGEYSLQMFRRNSTPSFTTGTLTDHYGKNAPQASATDWTEGICQIILDSYPELRPTIKSRVIGSVHGVFAELGVTDEENSRPSRYLPTSIRYLLNANNSED